MIFFQPFYIIASVIVMYRMSLKRCPRCKKVFIAEPYQRICGECKEQRRIEEYLRTRKLYCRKCGALIYQDPGLDASDFVSGTLV